MISFRVKGPVLVIASLVVLCGALPTWAHTKSGTVYTTDGSYADVNSAVQNASVGDTVTIPAGTFAWNTYLVIPRGINLIGAGAAKTTVINNQTEHFLIWYSPYDFSLNMPLRISGFTIDMNFKNGAIYLNYSMSDLTIQTKIRIDHMVFKNGTIDHQGVWVNGQRGVIDHNTFTNTVYPIRFASGPTDAWWQNWEGVVYGKLDNNMYVEDNTIYTETAVTNCQYSNRYVFRYNTITVNDAHDSNVLFDMHGNQGHLDGMWSCFGGELYGNNVIVSGAGSPGFLNQRGGKAVAFYNYINDVDAWGIKMTEDYCDDLNPTNNPQPQHVSDSYNWSNYKTGGIPLNAFWDGGSTPGCRSYQIAVNRDWWNYSPAYDGSAPGVGCGAAPPPSCSIGDGFWVTTQSCSDIASYIGKNPTEPISGSLYRCTAPNTWTQYYTPLSYPHPLRGPTPPMSVTIIR